MTDLLARVALWAINRLLDLAALIITWPDRHPRKVRT